MVAGGDTRNLISLTRIDRHVACRTPAALTAREADIEASEARHLVEKLLVRREVVG
jgi:hypothetical protein